MSKISCEAARKHEYRAVLRMCVGWLWIERNKNTQNTEEIQLETETVTGYVDHIIYRNAENGYTVLVLVVNEEELTCVGTFSDIAEGENIEAHGEYTEHATYGRQFKVVSFEEKEPEDEMAIERYLAQEPYMV